MFSTQIRGNCKQFTPNQHTTFTIFLWISVLFVGAIIAIYKVQSDNLLIHLVFSGLFLTLTAQSMPKGNQGMFDIFVQ